MLGTSRIIFLRPCGRWPARGQRPDSDHATRGPLARRDAKGGYSSPFSSETRKEGVGRGCSGGGGWAGSRKEGRAVGGGMGIGGGMGRKAGSGRGAAGWGEVGGCGRAALVGRAHVAPSATWRAERTLLPRQAEKRASLFPLLTLPPSLTNSLPHSLPNVPTPRPAASAAATAQPPPPLRYGRRRSCRSHPQQPLSGGRRRRRRRVGLFQHNLAPSGDRDKRQGVSGRWRGERSPALSRGTGIFRRPITAVQAALSVKG